MQMSGNYFMFNRPSHSPFRLDKRGLVEETFGTVCSFNDHGKKSS